MSSIYQVTELAGPYVSGYKVPPNGQLTLTDKEAAYPLLLRQITLVGADPVNPVIIAPFLRTDVLQVIREGRPRDLSIDLLLNAAVFAGSGLLVAAIGSSFEDGASRDIQPPAATPSRAFFNDGWLAWLRILSHQRVELPAEYILGASGSSWNTPTTGFKYQVEAVCRLYPKPAYCIVGGEPNDIGSRTFADIRDDWIAGIETLVSNGIKPVAVTTLPRGTNSLTTAQLHTLLQMNRMKIDYCRAHGIPMIDPWKYMADQTSATSNALGGMIKTSDNLHPSTAGAFWWGKCAAEVFSKILADRLDQFLASADIFNSVTNKTGNLLFAAAVNHGLLAGTSGTLTASTGLTHTGSVATGATAVRSGTSTCAWTHSKENPRTDAGRRSGERQVEVIAASAGGAVDEVYNTRFTPTFSNVSPGDFVEASCSIEVHQAPVRVNGLELYLLESRPSNSYTGIDGGYQSALGGYLPAELWSGVMKTPPIRIESDATALQLNIRARLDATSADASIGYKIGDVSLRKVAA